MNDADLTPSLVVRLRAGDRDAGALLEAVYRPAIHRLCLGYLGSPDAADDAVQDVFARVLQAGVVPDAFRVWIYRIARNRCLNLIRDRRRRRDDAELPPASRLGAAGQTGFLTALVDRERQQLVERAFAALGEAEQEALRLRYGEGLSRAEIAEVVGVPESTVKSRLFEGLQKLRGRVDPS